MLSALVFTTLVTFALAGSRTRAPAGAIIVGSGGNYSTIQEAIGSLNRTSTTAQTIFILAGTYNEQVSIAARSANLTIYGYTNDTCSYAANVVNVEFNCSQATCSSSNDATATISNHAANTKFYNINIKNTYGKGSQAVALSAQGTSQGYYGVGIYGYQDSLLANIGNQLYAKCYIEGSTDFIFGQHARAWIDGADIRVNGNGYITADGRSSTSDVSWYVINKSNVAAASSTTATTGGVYLGRPWGDYARVCFQNTALSSLINSTAWRIWSTGDERIDHVVFNEYGNIGAGAIGTRANFSSKLSSPLNISSILGLNYATWADTTYLSW